MKKYFLVAFIIIFVLGACAPEAKQVNSASLLPSETSTQRATAIFLATAKPSPSIPSITPLSIIPTFTPTFDIRTIVTVTPAEKAVCPKEDPTIKIDFLIPHKIEDILDPNLINDDKVLSYLNQGGSISQLIEKLQIGYMKKGYVYQDLTHDSMNELLIRFFLGYGYSSYSIYTCINRSYKSFALGGNWGAFSNNFTHIVAIKDLNKNGVPDIVIADDGAYLIIEWNGTTFKNIAYDEKNNKWPSINTQSRPAEIKDINHDGFDELILTGADIYYYGFNESYYEGMPWRDEIRIYAWNGLFYSQSPSEYSTPEYRFQAVQDGDRYTLQKEYERALSLYQNAIFSDKLNEWSPEMHAYETGILESHRRHQPTPTSPAADDTEYFRLAAYAYYRIMLLHVVRSYESDAGTVYNTLQQKFPDGNIGHPYVEMASTFWNEYQSSRNMTKSCGKAIQYAAEHPEILIPLGSNYHGAQSKIYKPEDICPFR